MRAALDDVSTRARPLRPADQLRLRPVHARDRRARRPRAARHDAQRLDVRDPLPRHQPDPHVRRPAVQPPGARPRRDHHQHRRGQLPHDRRRRRGRPHRHREPAAQRVLRQGGRPAGLAARPRARLRDQPGAAGLVPARARARPAGPHPVPGRAAEVDAADQAHDRRRLPRLPARRVLQPGRRADRPGHPAGRDDDRGRGHAVAVRPRPRPAERPLRHGRRRGWPRTSTRRPTGSSPPGPARCSARPWTCSSGSSTTRLLDGHRRRHLRADEAPRGRRQGPGRRRRAGRRLPQPGRRPARGAGPPDERRTDRPQAQRVVRPYGDTTGDGMVQVSFTLPVPARQARRGRRRPARREDGHRPRAGRPRQGDGAGLHLLRRLRARCTTSSTCPPSRSSSASTRCCRPRRSTPRSRPGCAASSSSSAPASAPTPTPSASTRSSTSRGSRGRRAWSTTARSRS